MTDQINRKQGSRDEPRTALFKVDEPLHRPPDGYRHEDGWDPYSEDPDQIDDN